MQGYRGWARIKWGIAMLALLAATVFPTDLEKNYATPRGGHQDSLVMGVETYARHLNSIVPLAMVLLFRDVSGLKQLAAVSLAGVVLTHGPKRALNDVEVMGTRLGQRPGSANSKHNMPSGHSALASVGAFFAVRRYSPWLGIVVWPVLLLTMYARVMLDAHTVSATIAGAITGALVVAIFVSPNLGAQGFFASMLRSCFARLDVRDALRNVPQRFGSRGGLLPTLNAGKPRRAQQTLR